MTGGKYKPKPPKEKPPKICLECGMELPNRHMDYCPECAEKIRKMKLQELNRQNALTRKGKIKKSKKKQQYRKRKKPIPHCWNTDYKSAEQINIEAKALGLTFGQYLSLCDTLFIERYLNEQGIYDGLDRIDVAWKQHLKLKSEQKKREKELEQKYFENLAKPITRWE